MQRESQSEFVGTRRSVSAILDRRRRESKKRRQLFPPDFAHGDVALADIYEVLGVSWVERALFVAGEKGVVTVAYFDDYFLVVEQWTEEESADWAQWWTRRRSQRDRVIALKTEERFPLAELEGISIGVDRERLLKLEQGILGVVRDGMTNDESLEGRLRQSQIDVLSLVTLVCCLSDVE